ncbi:hypothetical protein [Thalassobaculum litoreum]|uniref:Uncharacterized protein n=1 Tax=Thalassobaculum litoreum DSM 18839 TaxID=1123362 RepID=A0A8G2BGF6_9PROT|nr:hypothetical protein [Thalassobaculum litoreum]SDF54784.1 hypothetical protein SAMN05660686_01625 [Thalassobaculum litoreum DSM 18839]
MNGNHLLLLAHAATGGAGDQIERLIRQHHDVNRRHPEPQTHPADGRRNSRRRILGLF